MVLPGTWELAGSMREQKSKDLNSGVGRNARASTAIAVACAALMTCSPLASTYVAAQTAKAKSQKAPADAAAAQSANEQAEKLLQAGNAQGAANVLSSAISAGSLPPQVMARALYLRGVANRRLQKPAQAISDLTSALWVKNGLNATDRDDATKQRSAAYADAGLAEPAQGAVAPNPTPSPSQPAAVTPRAPSPTRQVAAAQPAATDIAAATSGAAQPPPPSASPGKTEWSGRGGKKIDPPTPPPSSGFNPFPDAPQSSSYGAPAATSGGGFLSSLFGGGAQPQQQPAQPAPPAETAAAPPPQPAPAATPPPAAPRPKASAAAPVKPREKQVAAAARTAEPPSPDVSSAPGNYNARVALVRTKAEADTILARLKSQYGAAVGGRSVAVDQSTFGNMGTFYQVKIEGYRSSAEAQAACDKLKGSGLDCVPVGR